MRLTILCLVLFGAVSLAQAGDVFPLTGQIVDADSGAALPARLYIQGADGKWHFPRSAAAKGSAIAYKKERPGGKSVEMHTTLSAHPFVVDLPPGEYTLTAERGHEYLTARQKVVVGKKPVEVKIQLKRWIDVAKRGWYSGDTHVHRTLEELPNVMRAEDLNVALPLTWWVTEAFTAPKAGAKAFPTGPPPPEVIKVDATHLIYPRNTEYEIFTVGKKRHTLGAFFVLNHRKMLERGVPPVAPIGKDADDEEALIELDKPNWPWSMMLIPILGVDLYELSNNHVWRTGFGFPNFGSPAPKYMNVETDKDGFTEWGWLDYNFQNYYCLLNCGFRLRPTAGTASGVHPVPLGFGRVYVHCERFSYEAWIKGLDAGRSFVSTGPMLFVQVNGKLPGHKFEQKTDKPVLYRIKGEAVSSGPLDRIEVIVNGKIAQKIEPGNKKEGAAYLSVIDAEMPLDASSWIAVRCIEQRDGRPRFAHTAPFHVEVPGKPLRPYRAEIDFLIERVETELKRNEGVLAEDALGEYRRGLEVYRAIAKTAKESRR